MNTTFRPVLLAALAALSSAAATFPTTWQPVAINDPDGGVVNLGDPISDGSNNGRNIVGDNARPAFFTASDATHFFFRMRLDTDPSGPGGLASFGWGILIDSDGDVRDYDYALMVNGTAETIDYSRKTTKTLAGDPTELADLLISSTPNVYSGAAQNVRITAVGAGTGGFSGNEDYFLDLAVPLSGFYGANPDGGAYLNFSPSTPLRFWVGVSNSSRQIQVDLGGTALSPGPGTLQQTASVVQQLCQSDATCGGTTSGKICSSAGACTDGCRGTGGNGCPSGAACTSSTSAAGSCVAAAPPVVSAPANGSRTGNPTPTLSGTSPASATIAVFLDGVQVGTTTASPGGAWSFTAPALAEGAHSVFATSTVSAVTSGPSNVNTFTVDLTPPPAPVIATPAPGAFTGATPTITGSAEANATVTVILDGVVAGTVTATAAGTWSFPSPTLAQGPHAVRALATDAVGNVSPSSATTTFTVDTVPPLAPLVTAPADGSVTASSTPALSGTAEPGATVTVSVDGAVVGTTTADGAGAWSVTSPALSDGPHTVHATARDAAGNLSPASPTSTFRVDTTPPAAPVVLAPAAGSTTANPTPTLAGTAEPGSTVAVFLDGALVGTTTADGAGAWSLTSPPLGDGQHAVRATATDAAGNGSQSSTTTTFRVDTVAPAAPVVSAPADGSSTTEVRPRFSGTAEPGSTVTLVVDGFLLGTTTADGAGAWSYTPPSPLAEGPHTVRAAATDAAGNTSPDSATTTFSVDSTPPAAPVVSAPADASVTGNPTPTVSGTAEPMATVRVFLDGALVGTTTADAAGAWSFQSPTLNDGPHTAHATATDAAGNPSPASATTSFTVDTAPPAPPVVLAPADGSLTAESRPTFSGTAEAGATVALVVDGFLVGTTTADGAGSWTYTPTTPLADGPHTVRAAATDAAGNTSLDSATNGFRVDTAPPAAPVVSAPADGSLTATATPTFTGTAEPMATVRVFVDGVLVGTTTADAAGSWGFTPGTPLADGPHAVRATATDAAGNASPSSTTSTFQVDTTAPAAPVVEAPADGSSTASPTPPVSGTAEPHATVSVFFDGVLAGTVVADASGAWRYTPGVALPAGPHTVRATAADAAGNLSGASATHGFTVLPAPPPTPVLAAPAEGSSGSQSTPTFSGTAEPGSTVTVRVDGAVSCTAVATASGAWACTAGAPLSEGAHGATVSAANPGGSSLESGGTRFRVDTTAPLTPAVVGPAHGSTTTQRAPPLVGTGEPGSVIAVSIDGQVVGTTTVGADGTWALTPAALDLGAHSVSAVATDAAGNRSLPSNTNTFTVVAPGAGHPVLAAPLDNAALPTGTPTYSGTASPGTTVVVRVDGSPVCTATADGAGAWSCAGSTALADGRHRVVAETANGLGGVFTSNAATFLVDTRAPAAPTVTSPADGSSTANPTPEFTGTAEPLSQVALFVDGLQVGVVAADVDGRWRFVPAAPLASGPHTVSATATDRAGNASLRSALSTFTVSGSGGTPSVLSPVAGAATNDASPTFSGLSAPGATVEVLVDGVVVCTATASASGTWACAPAAPLGEGGHQVTAREQGATSGSFPVPFVVDTVAPSPPRIDAPVANAYTSALPTLGGSAEPGARVAVFVDGAAVCVTLADAQGRWSCVPPAPLSMGAHTVTAIASDVAGNRSAPGGPVAFTVDETPPAAPVLTTPAGGASLSDATPRFEGMAEPGSTVTVRVDGQVVCQAVAGPSGAFACQSMVALAVGAREATATATDAAGNQSAPSARVDFTIVSPTPPAPAITGPVEGALLATSTPTVAGTAAPGALVTVREGERVLCTTTASATGAWSCQSAALGEGPHRLTATATVAGVESGRSPPRSITIDTTPPVLVATGHPEAPTPERTVTIRWEPEVGTTYECSLDGGPFTACASPVTYGELGPGQHTLVVRATDAAGNTTETSVSWFIRGLELNLAGGGLSCSAAPLGGLGPWLLLLRLLRRRSRR